MHSASLPFCTCFALNKSLTFWRQTVREMTDRQTDRQRQNKPPPNTINISAYVWSTIIYTKRYEMPLQNLYNNLVPFPANWSCTLVEIISNLTPPPLPTQSPFHSMAVVAMDNCFVRMCFVLANSFTCCNALWQTFCCTQQVGNIFF